MAKVALIETKPSRQRHLELDFVTDRFALCSVGNFGIGMPLTLY